MRRRNPRTIKLSRADQCELERLLRDGRTEQRVARRSQVLLVVGDEEFQNSHAGALSKSGHDPHWNLVSLSAI